MARQQDAGTVVYWNNIIISLIIFVVLTLLVLYLPNMRQVDRNILHSIQLALSPYSMAIPNAITDFGRANYMLWPQITVTSVLVSHKKYLKAFLFIFMVQLAYVIVGMTKNFVCRERPCVYPGFSFPSGHSLTTMCLYGIVIYLILHYCKTDFWRYFLAVVLGVFIFLVALSRLWLGVHFLSDVIAGLALGFLLVNLYIVLSKFFSR